MIEYYISSLTKSVCKPYQCSKNSFLNNKPVIHWIFLGDGSGDFQEQDDCADLEVVEEYLGYCQKQAKLAQEYLDLHKEKPHQCMNHR